MDKGKTAALPSLTDPDFLVAVTHQFVRQASIAESYEEVFNAVSRTLTDSLGLKNCLVFEVVPQSMEIFCNDIPGGKNGRKRSVSFRIGEDFPGWIAENQKSVLAEDLDQGETDFQDGRPILSRLGVPVTFHGELFAVLYSSSEERRFFNRRHVQLFELIAEIAASLLVRIRQQEELDHLKLTLEQHLEDKKEALNLAIETVSTQFSELKFQRDKKEVLLREVHHRVNNNLQIISSLVSLYLSHTKKPGIQTLQEIQFRIRVLSSIHLTLLKSLEMDRFTLTSFLEDLTSSIRYNCSDYYLSVEFDRRKLPEILDLDTFVPLGMLIHELTMVCAREFWKPGDQVRLHLRISPAGQPRRFLLHLSGGERGMKDPLLFREETIEHALVHALCEQLEGEVLSEDPSGKSLCRILFSER